MSETLVTSKIFKKYTCKVCFRVSSRIFGITCVISDFLKVDCRPQTLEENKLLPTKTPEENKK